MPNTERPDSAVYEKAYLFWITAFLVFGLDLTSKFLVREAMTLGDSWPDSSWPARLHYVTNEGAFLGFLGEQTALLAAMVVIGLVAIFVYYRFPPVDHPSTTFALGMILGGAVGNLAERIIQGEVTDFFRLPTTPTFNVADLSIAMGILAIIVGHALLTPIEDDPPAISGGDAEVERRHAPQEPKV